MAQKHPKGLYLLFVTEMAERFSYYGMRALFVLYMVAVLFTQDNASEIYGDYCGLVYLTPLIGGYVADRYWGNRRSIIAGGLTMAVGQLFMFLSACFVKQSIFEDGGSISSEVDNTLSITLMFIGLAALIIGNGFFKPNISTMVGDLYESTDKRKDSAFTIFYMGINIGAFIAPLICGIFEGNFADPSRFKWGFLIACIAMLLSVAIFCRYKSKLLVSPEGEQIGLPPTKKQKVTSSDAMNSTSDKLTKEEIQHIAVIFIIAVFVIFFWMGYEQAGSSLTYFADKQTERVILGWEVPTSWFQALPALFCVALAPVMAWIWEFLGRRNMEPTSVQKQAIGLMFLALSYLVIAIGVKDLEPGVRVSAMWITTLYFIQELGELSLSPIGLSMVTKLSPKRFASLLMGIWFLATAISDWLAGMFAAWFYPDGKESKYICGIEITDLHDFFLIFVVISAVASIILFCLCPWLKKMMKGVE